MINDPTKQTGEYHAMMRMRDPFLGDETSPEIAAAQAAGDTAFFGE
jgi:hypothetical protein